MGSLKVRWRETRPERISGLAYRLVSLISASMRIKIEGFPADPSRTIFCGWHGRSLVYTYALRNRGFWVIISQSRDGDIQNSIFERMGYRTIRGSTGRNGARAAVESIRALRDGGTMAMTPDGPRGPSGIVQPGVITMAQKSGAALIPTAVSVSPRKHARSWDSYMIPVPLGKCLILVGQPIYVPPKATPEELEAKRLELQTAMHDLQDEADHRLGYGVSPERIASQTASLADVPSD